MKALSIKQPWAWLIVNGHKDVENRTWALPRTFAIPQRIYVHAGKSFDWACDPQSWASQVAGYAEAMDAMADAARGAIVGEVTIIDQRSLCCPLGLNDGLEESMWYDGYPNFGFQLSEPVAYEKPIPYRGRLGFFEVAIES